MFRIVTLYQRENAPVTFLQLSWELQLLFPGIGENADAYADVSVSAFYSMVTLMLQVLKKTLLGCMYKFIVLEMLKLKIN